MTDSHEPILPQGPADLGDRVSDAVLDMIDDEPIELRKALRLAIKRNEFTWERHPGNPMDPSDAGYQLVRFPKLGREYAVPFVHVGPRRLDA